MYLYIFVCFIPCHYLFIFKIYYQETYHERCTVFLDILFLVVLNYFYVLDWLMLYPKEGLFEIVLGFY